MTDDSLAVWDRVRTDRDLLERIASVTAEDLKNPTVSSALRGTSGLEEFRLAVELVECRRRAAGKFADPDQLWLDREALEQATGTAIAAHKAQRFARALGDHDASVVDLCCGMGGDLRELRRSGGERVFGLDRDPLRAAMAGHNSGAEVRNQSVEAWMDALGAGDAVFAHCDPSRRSEGRRVWRLEDLQPGPELLHRLRDRSEGLAIKLGPGMDRESLGPLAEGAELEWIADGRSIQQLVVWSGALAETPGRHRATRIGAFSIVGEPGEMAYSTAGEPRFLIELDPVVERAGLARAVLGERAAELFPGLGLFESSEALGAPAIRAFEVRASMPWREPKVRRFLRANGYGEVVVKTRGGAVDANRLARSLGGEGAERAILFVLRLGRSLQAFVCADPFGAE